MPDLNTFFPGHTRAKYTRDLAFAATTGVRDGIFGGLLLAQMNGVAFSTATLCYYGGACALGGVFFIVPFMMAHKRLMQTYPQLSASFILQYMTNTMFKMAFISAAAALGAALLGLAIFATAKAALTGALAFAILKTVLLVFNNMASPNPALINTTDDNRAATIAL